MDAGGGEWWKISRQTEPQEEGQDRHLDGAPRWVFALASANLTSTAGPATPADVEVVHM
jgi:hypothetical protein